MNQVVSRGFQVGLYQSAFPLLGQNTLKEERFSFDSEFQSFQTMASCLFGTYYATSWPRGSLGDSCSPGSQSRAQEENLGRGCRL